MAEVRFNKKGTGGDPLAELRSLSKGQAIFHSFSIETFYKQQKKPRMFENETENSILGSYYKGKGHTIKIVPCPSLTTLQTLPNTIFVWDKHHYG